MARNNRQYTDPSNFWNGMDPRRHERVWINNDVYARMNRELEELRRNPKKADTAKLLRLVSEMYRSWSEERERFKSLWNELVDEYNRLLKEIDAKGEEIERLNRVLLRLNEQIEETIKKQNELQEQINEIQRDRNANAELARKYLNEAIEAYNLIVNNPFYHKYANEDVEALNFIFRRVESTSLDAAAVQGIAVESLGKLYAMNKRVIRKRTEFELFYAIVLNEALELRKQYADWCNNTYFDPENRHQADMAYWSRGLFTEYMGNVDEICHELENAPVNPDIRIEELRKMQGQLGELRKYGEITVNNVLALSLMSEKIEALANITAIIMVEDFFFKAIYLGFNNADKRSSYVVQLNNYASGIRLQFEFSPLNNGEIGCNYIVSFEGYQDEDRVNHILDAVWSELMPNKVNPIGKRGEVDAHIVDNIEFATQGQPIQIRTN